MWLQASVRGSLLNLSVDLEALLRLFGIAVHEVNAREDVLRAAVIAVGGEHLFISQSGRAVGIALHQVELGKVHAHEGPGSRRRMQRAGMALPSQR